MPTSEPIFNSAFEAFMMLCFSASWIFSLLKSARSKSTGGKSLLFMLIVFLGYVSGLLHKILFLPNWVIYLYSVNLIMVATDIALYFRNRRYEASRR